MQLYLSSDGRSERQRRPLMKVVVEMAPIPPARASLDSAQVIHVGDADSGVSFARLITRGEHGSHVTFGVHWLEPGAEHPWWSFEDKEDIYFVIRGHLRLTWEEGVLDIGSNMAAFLPPGRRYSYKNVSDEPAFFVYSMYPASV